MHALDLNVPDEALSQEAEEAIRVLRDLKRSGAVRLQPEGAEETVALPGPVFDLLVKILAHMANGDAVAVVPVQAEISPQQAAELLNVSTPFVVDLIEAGDLPARKVGAQRRLLLTDVLEYRRQDRVRRQEILAKLTQEAQEMGLDY